jgi:hypothetical protein
MFLVFHSTILEPSLHLKEKIIETGSMCVRRGGQEGALAPLWLAKIVCFSAFFEENSMFFGGFFNANFMFLPPVEKSLRTHMTSS